jgi:hypothetical protein
VCNQITAIASYTSFNDIIMLLDGDDWLVNDPNIFHKYNNIYRKGAEFTYGSCYSLVDRIPLIAQPYPPEVKANKSYRKYKFAWNMPYTHLRTFKINLMGIDLNNFKDKSIEKYSGTLAKIISSDLDVNFNSIPYVMIGDSYSYNSYSYSSTPVSASSFNDRSAGCFSEYCNAKIFRNGTLKSVMLKDLKVGDIIEINSNQRIPADMILLYTKESNVFIRTD